MWETPAATKLSGAILLAPAGRIELSNADAFRDALLAAVAASERALILDFSGIEYISSAGLRSLMIASKSGKSKDVVLALAALRPIVKEIFTISRFHLVFPLFDSVRDALAKLAPEALVSFDAP